MPKKAVVWFLGLALLGAAIFIYFTFPRTRAEIPTSNNQRPFPSAPSPNNEPVPESVPHSNPAPPEGPTLQVMAWASPAEARALETAADEFAAETGHRVSLTVDGDEASYRRDLRDALAARTPPDVCLVEARDFSGLDPNRDLAEAPASADAAPRSVAAFTVVGRVRAVPDEFAVEALFYNPHYFDVAGFGYPDRHWNWDILEAIARGLASLKLHDDAGDPVYPLELAPDFDLWNVLSAQAGSPALDLNVWHLSDASGHDAQVRALDFIHEMFQGLVVTAPLPGAGRRVGSYFAAGRAALLIASSATRPALTAVPYAMTVLPQDMGRANLAQVRGWGVTAVSPYPQAAQALAIFLSKQPVHAGWSTVQGPAPIDGPEAICREALDESLLPRVGKQETPLVNYFDREVDQLARSSQGSAEATYKEMTEKFRESDPSAAQTGPTVGVKLGPKPGDLRGL
jgi:ABC-type glycerol-3-phosphate transport system substrate-binding protein